jgi:kynurenine 3-monooxygenase
MLAAVIGAGPVGCLTALGLVQRGYEVTLYEVRPEEAFLGANIQTNAKSINLAISTRGLTALSSVDSRLAEEILDAAVPMRARMIHPKPSSSSPRDIPPPQSQLYSDKGQCINSVSRNLLNRRLLDEVMSKGVQVCWSHKLIKADLDGRTKRKEAESSSSTTSAQDKIELIFDSPHEKGIHRTADLIVGCDGQHSKVRGQIGRATEMDFSQRHIDNYYSELHIPAKKNGDFALDPNHLHIWPRQDFLLIALANKDKSFTSTIFAPKRVYKDHFNDERRLLDFFNEEFPDVVDLIGIEHLTEDLLHRKPSPLSAIECNPYHFKGKAIILGDSAHAMVPFYGQGLNCGLEDVRIMFELMDKHLEGSKEGRELVNSTDAHLNEARERAFDEYSATRYLDLVAISQLALDNYQEMSSKVVSSTFLLRKKLDTLLSTHLPDHWWDSLYSLVTFSNIGYHKAQQRENRQKHILNIIGFTSLATLSIGGPLLGYRIAKTFGWLR